MINTRKPMSDADIYVMRKRNERRRQESIETLGARYILSVENRVHRKPQLNQYCTLATYMMLQSDRLFDFTHKAIMSRCKI